MKFFSIRMRMLLALEKSFMLGVVICIVHGWLLFVMTVDGLPRTPILISFGAFSLIAYVCFLFLSLDEELHEKIKDLRTLLHEPSKEEKETIVREIKRLNDSLSYLKSVYTKYRYKKAVDQIVYPVMKEMYALKASGDLRYTHMTHRFLKIQHLLKEHYSGDVSDGFLHTKKPEDKKFETLLDASNGLTAQIENSLEFLNKTYMDSTEAKALLKEIKVSLQSILNNNSILDYLKHSATLSKVFSIYMGKLYSSYSSYVSIKDLVHTNPSYQSNCDEIEEHLIEHMKLIYRDISLALDDYVVHVQGKVSASSDLMKQMSTKKSI